MKNLLLFFIFILPNFALGQVNIESIRTGSNSNDLFWGETKGGLDLQRGNVDITSLDISLVSHFKIKKHHMFFKGQTSQGKQSGKKFKSSSFGHIRWTWMHWKKLGYEIFYQIQHDEFKALKIRQLNGLGLRSELFCRKDFVLSFGSGAMHDYEKLLSGPESNDLRSTSYLSMIKSFDEKKKNLILLTVYYQPLFNNYKDYRVNLEASVRTILISYWNISIDNSINFMYDTKPPEDVLTNDLIVKTKLVYTW